MTPDEYLKREEEIQLATKEFPGMEMMDAYMKWKQERGEQATWLNTGDPTIESIRKNIKEAAWKPCEKCGGKSILEPVCKGCVEGRKGYRSKFICEDCLHRELSIKDYMECLQELSSSLKA